MPFLNETFLQVLQVVSLTVFLGAIPAGAIAGYIDFRKSRHRASDPVSIVVRVDNEQGERP